ncbi:hypothetical protein DKX38_023661 [Salix brachista]|uniref:Uncharacterized protein n=1 Tax=Salix brachista TaxID=2182728 RepID=A0A5N5JKF0_9ROSI|nr:hypothetical protein DKX38_023661 [Salix brachista]
MSETHLSEIRVDPLINKEEVLIQNNQPQELQMDETLGNNSSQNNERSLWLGSIMRLVTEDENNQPLSPKIPRVPHKLRNENEECYRPLVVSIGPYHYPERDTTLREVETLKVPMARQFILDGGKDIELIYSELEKVIKTAREFYNEIDITGFDDEQFARMMFLDGCFILQFISCVTHNNENLEMSYQQVVGVKRDLLLLENQVPFPVLQSLMRLRYEKNETDHGLKLLNDFLFHQILNPRDQPLWTRRLLWPGMLIITIFSYVFFAQPIFFIPIVITAFIVLSLLDRLRLILTGKKRKASASGYDWQLQAAQQPAHLLELLLSLFICSHKSKAKSSPRRYGQCLSYLVTCCKKIIPAKPETVVARESRGHYLYSSAKNLKKVGIHFMPSQTSGLMDVKFKPSFFYGTVKLPTLTIDVSTKPLLLNLVAYEKSTALDQLPVTSYICFMDSLIDDADDVKELRSKGIIVNFLGSDQQVADLFNNMGSSLEPDNSAYNDVKREINRQYESTLKRWVAEMQQTYFHSPWAFLAFAAATVGLALTATQVYYTIHPPKKHHTEVPRLLHTSSLKADQEGQQPNASWDSGNQEGKQPNPSATYSKGSTFASTDSRNQKCYDPSLVSIGPCHHGKPQLDMEMLKVTFTSKFVDDSGLSIQYPYGKVAEVATDARRYYAEDSTDEFDDEKFT